MTNVISEHYFMCTCNHVALRLQIYMHHVPLRGIGAIIRVKKLEGGGKGEGEGEATASS
jgi:hypothetical protein